MLRLSFSDFPSDRSGDESLVVPVRRCWKDRADPRCVQQPAESLWWLPALSCQKPAGEELAFRKLPHMPAAAFLPSAVGQPPFRGPV